MANIRYLNSYGMPGGFNITSGEPIDSRMYVADIAHIYDPKNWEKVKPYNGLIVSDPNGNIRICVDATKYQLEASWKIVNVGDIEIPEVAVKGVDSNDKILSLETNTGLVKSTLNVEIGSLKEGDEGYKADDTTEYIIIRGKEGQVVSKVDASRFVVDGMISSVGWSTDEGKENYLVITWNTDAGIEKTEINFGRFIDTWTHRGATKGIAVQGDNYVGVVDPTSESYLTVGDKGFKIEGIADINDQVQAHETSITDIYNLLNWSEGSFEE